jgi:hypothetical protein
MEKCFAVLAAFLLLIVAHAASATQFTITGTSFPNYNSATVDFNYTPLSATSGQISIVITNTSDVVSSLTAFAFNTPSNVTGLSSFAGPTGWSGICNPDSINTPMQYGFFDFAGITGPNFNGGKVASGIAMGQTGSFTLDIAGTSMLTLTTADFLALLSDLSGKVGTPEYFAGRYQGIGTSGGSDVAVPGNSPVSEPSTFLLSGVGMLIAVVFARRKYEDYG